MKLLVFSFLFAVSNAATSLLFREAPLLTAPISIALPIQSQYHTQDQAGQYSYGYSNIDSAKSEQRTSDGVTRGGYSYVDANGLLQSVVYESDPINGFRVAATNLPQAHTGLRNHIPGHVDVIGEEPHSHKEPENKPENPSENIIAVNGELNENFKPRLFKLVQSSSVPIHTFPINQFTHHIPLSFIQAAPISIQSAPVQLSHAPISVRSAIPIRAPISVLSTNNQFQIQDELGQYSYGYSTDLSSKTEARSLDGVTKGAYSYVDANGILQSVNYISDAENGFRVAATNLPIGPTISERLNSNPKSPEVLATSSPKEKARQFGQVASTIIS